MQDSQEKPEVLKTDQSAPAEAKPAEAQTVPYDRFKQVNDEFKALKDQFTALEAAELKRKSDSEAAEKKRLESQNEFQKLYETAEAEKAKTAEQAVTLAAQVEAMTKALEAQWEAQKELIPELYRDLVGQMPIDKRIEWLSVNKEKLSEKDKGTGTPRRTSRGITPPEQTNTRERVRSAFNF